VGTTRKASLPGLEFNWQNPFHDAGGPFVNLDSLPWRAGVTAELRVMQTPEGCAAAVEGLDLSELEDRIKVREHTRVIRRRLLLALWLYATSDGVGSARALAQLCRSHDVCRWLCGGVSVNHCAGTMGIGMPLGRPRRRVRH
jgi:hypothetical protein